MRSKGSPETVETIISSLIEDTDTYFERLAESKNRPDDEFAYINNNISLVLLNRVNDETLMKHEVISIGRYKLDDHSKASRLLWATKHL